jgi:glyoxylase I family protein
MFKRVDHVEIVPSDANEPLTLRQHPEFQNHKQEPGQSAAHGEVIYLQLGDTVIEVISADGPTPKSEQPWQVGYRGT